MYQKIILGTAQFGMKYGISNKIGKIKNKNILKLIKFLKKKKIKFLDTASQYKTSENEIGKFYKKTKIKFSVITKYILSDKISIRKQLDKTYKNIGYYPDTILA